MAADDQIGRLRAIADRVARSYGLDVFDLQFRPEARGWVLRIFVDRPAPPDEAEVRPPAKTEEGVSIEDCRRVSEDVSAILDVEDPVDHAYTLEVSSPGLDRPLRGAGDYRRFAGRLAKIVLREAVEGQKYVVGRLGGLEDDVVVLVERAGRIRRVPLGSIARARLEVEF